jgi:hypothetical protein
MINCYVIYKNNANWKPEHYLVEAVVMTSIKPWFNLSIIRAKLYIVNLKTKYYLVTIINDEDCH